MLDQNNQFINSNNDREKLIFLGYRVYHEINKNESNHKEVIDLTKQYIQSIVNLKPEEYNPQVLPIVQKYIKDEEFRKKLQKINEKNPRDNLLPQDGKFYFYE